MRNKFENTYNFSEARKSRRRKKSGRNKNMNITYSTGYPSYDTDMFNRRFSGMSNTSWEIEANKAAEEANRELGTFAASSADGSSLACGGDCGEGAGEGMSENMKLKEAKRYVRRYYIRPINKFCSTKVDIINYLIEYNDRDCVIYTLNNLVDNDDVTKLSSKDIIYYYEDGMLFDKNHMKLMDYELAVKNEEERELLDIENASEKDLRRVYADRIIGAKFEENIDLPRKTIRKTNTKMSESKHELDLDFCDVDANRKKLREANAEYCCICGEELEGYGNNPYPVKKEGKCCDACNMKFVIPARISDLDIK